MGRINLNPRRAKSGRCYDVREVAELYSVSKGTVRSWLESGLDPIDDHRPMLIQGTRLNAFIATRRAKAKQASPPGFMRCFRCRGPRKPRPETVEFRAAEQGAGMLRGQCEACGTTMNRRTNPAQIEAVLPGMAVPITQDLERISMCAPPPSIHHIVKRRAIGTPYRRPIGTPLFHPRISGEARSHQHAQSVAAG